MTDETSTAEDENAALEKALENDAPAHADEGKKPEAEAPKVEAAPKPAAKKKAKPKPKPTPPRKVSTTSQAQQEAKVARDLRLQEAQEQLPPETPVTDEEIQVLEEKAGLQARLEKIANQIQELEDGIEALKGEARDVMGQLYPASVASDRHVDAVRGYLQASQEERRTRGAHPARLKELLARAGKAPIDAAFQRARARGQGRPTRSPVGQAKAPAEDQAAQATPGQE